MIFLDMFGVLLGCLHRHSTQYMMYILTHGFVSNPLPIYLTFITVDRKTTESLAGDDIVSMCPLVSSGFFLIARSALGVPGSGSPQKTLGVGVRFRCITGMYV